MRFVYPPRCLACGEETETEKALCAPCWADTYFTTSPSCDMCSATLPGEPTEEKLLCDACLYYPQSWVSGRAVAVYSGTARRIILSLKHGDRLDIAPPLGRWMAAAAVDVLADTDVLVPVPLHWSRLLRRKYNQSALLAQGVQGETGVPLIPDLLIRRRKTSMQKGMTKAERLENQRQAIIPNSKRLAHLRGKRVLLIDDVLTTGATLSACAEACYSGGADVVNTLVFARVATDR